MNLVKNKKKRIICTWRKATTTTEWWKYRNTHTHARSLRREGDEDSRRSATVGSRCCCCFCLCICCRTGSWAEYCLKSALFIVFYSIFLHFHLIQHSSHIKALIAAFFIGKLYLYACVTLATSLTYFLSCVVIWWFYVGNITARALSKICKSNKTPKCSCIFLMVLNNVVFRFFYTIRLHARSNNIRLITSKNIKIMQLQIRYMPARRCVRFKLNSPTEIALFPACIGLYMAKCGQSRRSTISLIS